VRSVCFDPSSRYIACGGEFEHVYIWDLKKKKKVFFNPPMQFSHRQRTELYHKSI
jgi:hypothetical protein